MNDDKLNRLLDEWASKKLPSSEKREELLDQVLHFSESKPMKRSGARFYRNGIVAVIAAISIILIVALIPRPDPNVVVVPSPPSRESVPIRLSLLVLQRQSGSETAVDILEDTILSTKDQEICELSVGDRKLFLWVYALESNLFTLDLGIDRGTDQSSETGIVVAPDQTQAVRLRSNGDEFDVFVSVL